MAPEVHESTAYAHGWPLTDGMAASSNHLLEGEHCFSMIVIHAAQEVPEQRLNA